MPAEPRSVRVVWRSERTRRHRLSSFFPPFLPPPQHLPPLPSFVRSFVPSLVPSFLRSFARSLAHSFAHLLSPPFFFEPPRRLIRRFLTFHPKKAGTRTAARWEPVPGHSRIWNNVHTTIHRGTPRRVVPNDFLDDLMTGRRVNQLIAHNTEQRSTFRLLRPRRNLPRFFQMQYRFWLECPN